MELTEETKKRIGLITVIVLAVAGALFMIFAFFLNKGTITITAKAPYLLNIERLKSVACQTDTCSATVAPGEYSITVSKEGYRDVVKNVNVPIAGESKEEIEFRIIPVLTILGDEKTLNLFAVPSIETKDLPPQLFYDGNYVLYIDLDPQTHRQTLYVQSIANGKAGEKTVVTSFVRTLKNYLIVGSIEKNNKIALIDTGDDGSTLYMIDLKKPVTRTNLFSYPVIKDVKWLPGSDDFLFEARAAGDLTESIYAYSASQQKAQKLDLKTPLALVVPVTKDRLIAATIQQAGAGDPAQLEGQLVSLGELPATPSAAALFSVTAAPVLKFIDYSLVANQSRLLKTAPDLALPQKGKLSETGKSAYFLIDGKDYELQFTD